MTEQPTTPQLAFMLDGVRIPFTAGQSILAAAHAAGHYIPHLCFHPNLSPHGSCRLCIVSIHGRMAAACTTPAQADAEVSSATPELTHSRRLLTQLLFVEGNHFCPSCEVSGQCQLQAMAYHLGMQDSHFLHLYPHRELDASHPDVLIDRDRCINCALCVRASHEVDHKPVFELGGRGIHSSLRMASDSGKLADTPLDASDRSAHICPVGTILPRSPHYQHKPGQRLYDQHALAEIGNQRADRYDNGESA